MRKCDFANIDHQIIISRNPTIAMKEEDYPGFVEYCKTGKPPRPPPQSKSNHPKSNKSKQQGIAKWVIID